MEPMTGPLAQSLERQRVPLNARFAAAQKAGARIDAEAFLAHLAQTLDPIVRAVASTFAEKVDAVTAALYDLSLSLFSTHILGPQTSCPPVIDAWRRLLPAVPRLLAREPARVAASVTNAVHNVAATPGARPTDWIDWTVAAAPHLQDAQALLDCGAIFAWRAGLVKCRDGALATGRRMEPALAARALGLPADTPHAALIKAIERLAADAWITPAEALADKARPDPIRIATRVGAFRGFGGPFIRPPTARTVEGHIVVDDGEHSWRLTADVFGHAFARVDVPHSPLGRVAPNITAGEDGTVTWGRASVRFDELESFRSLAFDGRTLAVTVTTSHQVFLLARG
jgi:hypothetical protein